MLVVFSYMLMLVGWMLVSVAVTGTENSVTKTSGVCIGLFIFVIGTMTIRRDPRPASFKRRIVGWSMKSTAILVGVFWVASFALDGFHVSRMTHAGMATAGMVFFIVGDWITYDTLLGFLE